MVTSCLFPKPYVTDRDPAKARSEMDRDLTKIKSLATDFRVRATAEGNTCRER
ncbi:MAG: hypothetical protein WA618_05380 [Terriglobales bacterium]